MFNVTSCFIIGRENEPLDVEMLLELLQAVVRADRILSDPFGRSLLLIGRSGVGRKLVALMFSERVREICLIPSNRMFGTI
jgi:hypothetical protein